MTTGHVATNYRFIPRPPWIHMTVLTVALSLLGLGCWEAYWRSRQFVPQYRNSDGMWALTRAQLDHPRAETTVIIGSSRMLFDINLETWAYETGLRPVQLALEGTNPRPILTHLARESDVSGLVVVGVTPPLFFTPGFGYREEALERYRTGTPSQWLGQRISMLIEPYLAFYTFDTELFRVIRRQTWWPARPGFEPGPREVRRLETMRRTRQCDMWSRLDNDPEYAALCQDIWRDILYMKREQPSPEEARRMFRELLDQVRSDVQTIRDRGGEVVFIRAPSAGEFREVENRAFPRDRFWDVLLEETDAVGVHFEDYPELADLRIPEWSHVSARDTDRFTRVVVRALREKLAARGITRPELHP